MTDEVTLTIDGLSVTAASGTTIHKAAESAERKRWKAVTREYREQQQLGR